MTEEESPLTPFDEFILRACLVERAVLSCLRQDLPTVGSLCSDARLEASHFPSHGGIFSALMESWRNGREFDIVSIKLGPGKDYHPDKLREVLYEQVSPSLAPGFIKNILDNAATRKLKRIGDKLAESAWTEDPQELLTNARSDLEAIYRPHVARKTFKQFLMASLDEIQTSGEQSANSIELGLGLDEKAGPFCRSDLIIIAGETGRGKSALAGNIVEKVASDGLLCAVMSLEMTGVQNAERMLASQSRVNTRAMRMRRRLGGEITNLDQLEEGRMLSAVNHMSKWRIEIIEEAADVLAIQSELIRIKTTAGALDLVVVDYAQLVEGLRSKGDNREREVASISRTLKVAATKLNCLVILLSQLNDDGRLRESRALGQDANAVLFLEQDGDKGMRVRVGKARSAPSGVEVPLQWLPQFTRFQARD